MNTLIDEMYNEISNEVKELLKKTRGKCSIYYGKDEIETFDMINNQKMMVTK